MFPLLTLNKYIPAGFMFKVNKKHQINEYSKVTGKTPG